MHRKLRVTITNGDFGNILVNCSMFNKYYGIDEPFEVKLKSPTEEKIKKRKRKEKQQKSKMISVKTEKNGF